MSFCLYNKKNITRQLEDMILIFLWQKQYFTHSLRSFNIVLPLENKIHIFAPPCNILYVMKCIETVKHPKTSWESQAGDCGLVSHIWVLNATCTMTFYVYFSPYRNLVSIILSPVLLFCSSIVSFFSCSLKSQRRMPDRRLAPDPSRKRLIIWCPQISKGFFFPWLDGFLTLKQSFYLSIYLSIYQQGSRFEVL